MKCEGERSEECKGDEGERGVSEKLKREERVKNVGEKEKYITIIITTIIKITNIHLFSCLKELLTIS